MSSKRLFSELKSYKKDPQIAHLSPSENSFHEWTAVIQGPDHSCYSGYYYKLHISVGEGYPLHPPEIKFVTRMCHPNVHFKVGTLIRFTELFLRFQTGEICLDLFKSAWSPTWTLQSACIAIIVLLTVE